MNIYIKRKSRELLCEVLPVVSGSWRHIGMYASHATIGLNINARWWLGSHHLLLWKDSGRCFVLVISCTRHSFQKQPPTSLLRSLGPGCGGQSRLHPYPLENIYKIMNV